MNTQECDILNLILSNTYTNQRTLAEDSGHSLGIVNRSIKTLIAEGYLDESIQPTPKALRELTEASPKRAIILAAGFGMRMVPINTETSKGLLEVNGEILIERTIRQLHEVGITEIYIVVGFMKEQYEYLIDAFGVELIVNSEYATKNNLYSMKLAAEHLLNAYVIPCDIWCNKNPFSKYELYSWYMVSDLVDDESDVRVNRKMELVSVQKNFGGNSMIGICYLVDEDADFVKASAVENISVLKKGMTNRSFLFECKSKKYIMRIPGEGTDQLINRREEAEVYNCIKDKNICDDITYINPENGYKITEFLENARVCDPFNEEDVKKCMKRLHDFHDKKLKVNHDFDMFGQIEFYEKLWDGKPSVYKDYLNTKKNVLSLKKYVEENAEEKVLTHIDAVPDNFLFIEKDGKEDIRLIDWEYAGMQDPHVDVAMFCIYSLYNREQVDNLINDYFVNQCSEKIRIKIYCYIAIGGLLWSNWCEYKRNLGIEFGEYSLRQYRYAKEYYRIVEEELNKLER